MKRRTLVSLLVLVACAMTGASSFAAMDEADSTSSKSFYASLNGGYAMPSESNIGSRPTFGIGFGYGVTENISVGLFANHSSKTVTSGPAGATVSTTSKITLWGVDARYNLCSLACGFFGGLKLGMATQSGSATVAIAGVTYSAGATGTDFTVGPTLGYNFAVSEMFTLGPQVDAMMVSATTSYWVINALAAFNLLF